MKLLEQSIFVIRTSQVLNIASKEVYSLARLLITKVGTYSGLSTILNNKNSKIRVNT